jgi:type II secretory pathway component HofQ
MKRSLLGLSGLLVAAVAFATPDRTDPSKSETPAERVRKVLDQQFSVEFQGHSLPAAIEALREQTKLNIILDRASLLQMGLEPETFVLNLKLKNVKLRTILKHTLGQFNLTHMVEQDVLYITGEAQAMERQIRQRVNIDFEKLPLDQALRQLSRETGVNLVIDPRHASKIKETVTLKLEDVPLEIAVRLVSEVAGLRSVRQANVIFVTSREVAAELRKEETGAVDIPIHPIMEHMRFIGGGGIAVPAAAPIVQPAEKPAEKDK